MAEEALRSTSPKANFHRLSRLLMRGGVQLLRETLDSIHSPANLPLRLADPVTQAQLRGARLTQPEMVCLYPSPGVYGESNDFDITLIFKLLRTICSLTPPPGPRGWDDLPNSSDYTLVADLVRIKYYRNEIYGHRPTMEISDSDFIRFWKEISEALLRIATNISPSKRNEWKKSIADLFLDPLTPNELRCIEELETWYKQDMDVKDELVKLREELGEELRSLKAAFVAIQMDVERYHRAAGSEPTVRLSLPEPEEAAEADDPGPNNPPEINIWNVILSFKKPVDLFLRYLRYKLNLPVHNSEVGSWHITVECSSLQVLEGLWEDYCSGHLNSVAQEMLITPQVLEKLGLTELKLKTFISEDQYDKGKKLLEASSGAEDKREIQSALQATITKAISEGSIEPANNDDDGFDLIRPSLIQQLRTILDQYPDDGQILKELIQNAEDAHASHVKFLHDKRSHGTAKLHRQSLAQFQGPALYAYNNAQFTQEDWKGIRMLCDSIKVKDPMKVGRFGLGFKSVFHMTDLPSIVSGSQIGVIDPHEKYFSDESGKRTGHRWRLKEDRDIINSIPDQFQPYKEILDCTEDTFKQGSYSGTLFRFPLRREPSKLSQTLYTTQKVHTLFESFEADAHLILLFLQYLESVELFVREETDSDARKTFQVRITDNTLKLVREKRNEFRSKISSAELLPATVRVTYPITIEAITYSKGMPSASERHSFLVTNYFCGGEISSQFRTLASDQDLSYLPLVGVAMELPEHPGKETPDMKGHVFCFLPLPVQKTSLTGLPVHINGFFALSQNRRYIKTPTAEQENLAEKEGQPLTDKSLLWNQCLLQEAIPKAYASLLLDARDEQNYNVQSEAVYKAWPNTANIDQKWKRVEKPLFELLLDKSIIYTPAQGGKWLKLKDVIVERLAEGDPKELLVNVFLAANENVACLPEHALKAICLHSTLSAEITPSLTRKVLKNVPSSYSNLTRLEKLFLLKFVLKDGYFSDLLGLELLPISNEQFMSFSSTGEVVYISSLAHPRELLPCPQHKFLDESIEEELSRMLDEVAKEGCTQLRHFTKDDVAKLLPTSLPPGWLEGQNILWCPGVGDHPSNDWLGNLWAYLGKNFPSVDELCGFQGLPLLPLDMSEAPIALVRLQQLSPVVVRSLHGDSLDDAIVGALKELGVSIMQGYPGFLGLHPAVSEKFVHPPSVQGVLKAVAAFLFFKPTAVQTMTDDGKRYFRKFVAKASSLSPDDKKILNCIPLFETLSGAFVSKNDGLCAAPDEVFPVKTLRDLIDIRENDAKRLAGLLDIKVLTRSEVLLEVIFPDVIGQRYSTEEIDRLMGFVIDRYQVYTAEDGRFQNQLEDLPFVSTKNDRVRPREVFDPRDDFLRRIFVEEDVFPIGKYTQPTALVVLEYLGMKGKGEITGQKVYESAKAVNNIIDLSAAETKSSAILSFLTSNPKNLQEIVSGTSGLGELGMHLKSIPWVSVIRQKPDEYPESLPFWGETHTEPYFLKPSDVKYKQAANIIGSTKALVKAEPCRQFTRFFSWNADPAVLDVVQHLQNVISCYSPHDKPRYIIIAQEMYAFLSRADHNEVIAALENVKNLPWIWNGDGFSSPRFLISQKPPINLTPYICSLPSEMARFYELFAKFGLQEKCNDAFLLEVLHLIKEKYDNYPPPSTAEVRKDLQLSVDILNDIKPNVGDRLPPELQEKVLIPTHVEDDAYVKLAPVERCMYCEHEWLERSNHDGEEDDEMDYFYVHPNIPNSTAELLGVRTLMNVMLEPDELDFGEEFGQEEKLTRRLSRLLEDYSDGFAVPKELVQNADDAGATEVRFLYDERTNQDAINCLIDEEMKHCQGPALWAYNDAEFRDEDFTNITKLNGAKKEQETEKIGKFGLGFNAVYNLTDVPMFLSRNFFVIFDPHKFYLGKSIRNKSKPGIKINLNKNTKRLRSLSNQFKPFNGIFDCDLHLNKDDYSYSGTLFRFPLRTKEQAIKSEIKRLHYDNEQMKEFLKLFASGAKTLLLFTQNVVRVSFYHLPKDSTLSCPPSLLFEVSKSLCREGILRELSFPISLSHAAKKLCKEEQYLLQQSNFLQASSVVAKNAVEADSSMPAVLSSALTINIKSTTTESGKPFVEAEAYMPNESQIWLVASSMGKGLTVQFRKDDMSLLPSAGVAARLTFDDYGKLLPVPVVDQVTADGQHPVGKLFCYLPLPVKTGLPVHVNGAFAVASSRRGLKEKTADDKDSIGVEWNNCLMQDAVCEAYLDLLEDVKTLAADKYQFYSLWPRACEVEQNCEPLARSFYQSLASKDYSLFSNGSQWVNINHVVFLEPNFRYDPKIGELSFEALKFFKKDDTIIIDLPAEVYQSFVSYDLVTRIQEKNYDKSRFFRELFFPNIASVPPHLGDHLVLYALDDKDGELDDLIKTYACIPTSPKGRKLKCPAQLINPTKLAASLFNPEDEMFPLGTTDTFLNGLRLAKLEQLGMLADDLPWPQLAERAQSISVLCGHCSDSALKRAKDLIDHLERNLMLGNENRTSFEFRETFLHARFLPVLQRPESFPLPWKADEFQFNNGRVFMSPTELFPKRVKNLVCCTELVLDLHLPTIVQEFLQLGRKQVTLDHVKMQLNSAASVSTQDLDSFEIESLKEVCSVAYRYLEEALCNKCITEKEVGEFFSGKKFILCEGEFVLTEKVAFELHYDCSPYLRQLPRDLVKRFGGFLKTAGVKAAFDADDFIASLKQIKHMFGEENLDEKSIQVAVNMAVQLGHILKMRSTQGVKDEGEQETVFLPDSLGVMRPVGDLCMGDCDWIPHESGVHLVNEMIPFPVSARLGVKTRREETLNRLSTGIPFGQSEQLENRLRRILTAYPCQKEILKELLQNADDAQATEICFISDPRQHSDERVFGDSWKLLQGPALCVYNNRPFTEADIVGIQNLGEGSKGDDPNKTGQYGVGFNSVYHLTDVPSFVSCGEEIGNVLCVFDPHYKYVPGATKWKPGRMYREAEKVKKVFPDVFSCYDQKECPVQNSTMFRFPLRTEEMANSSKISKTPVTPEVLEDMMKALKEELFEVLIFVNNVRKITLCDIDPTTGERINIYSVAAVMSEEDKTKRQEFATYMKNIRKSAEQPSEHYPYDIEVKICSYVLNLQDNCGNQEKWLVVQQVGFEKQVQLSIKDAYRRGDLGMLPRGGVACLLEKSSTLDEPASKAKKAYCFLPLPLETNLPLHINGHFALNHESRRNLWRDEAGGYRTDWNNALLGDVIASCYLTLLDEVRSFFYFQISPTSAQSNDALFTKICEYEKLFPSDISEETYWATLIRSVYRGMDEKGLKLLPVVRVGRSEKNDEETELAWLPPTGEGEEKAFFNNLGASDCFVRKPIRPPFGSDLEKEEKLRTEKIRRFEDILLQTGFNLVKLSLFVYDALKKYGVESHCISPSAVMAFYKTFNDDNPLCCVGLMSVHIKDTPFKGIEDVLLVLSYCKDDENFLENLSGLPLLVTQKKHLHTFSPDNPKYLSRHHGILPQCSDMFVHHDVRLRIFNAAKSQESPVFKRFGVEDFATFLDRTLPCEYSTSDRFVAWRPTQESLPNKQWVEAVWKFLGEETECLFKEERKTLSQGEEIERIKTILEPLSNWSILPCTETIKMAPSGKTEHFLVPLNLAQAVLDFSGSDIDADICKLVESLRKLSLAEVNYSFLPTESMHLARKLVASLKTPESVLKSLELKMSTKPKAIEGKLTGIECRNILDYFSRNVERLQERDKRTLMKLPFYQTTHGGFTSTWCETICVLPFGIPREEMEQLGSRLGVVFLEEWKRLLPLYKFLEFKCVSSVDFYCKFILQNMEILSSTARFTHLKHIRDVIFPRLSQEDRSNEQKLVSCLSETAFVPFTDGSLKRASFYYEPGHEVFSVLLPEDMFPPEPFNTPEWLKFLRKIGLTCEVSADLFLEFAIEIEREGETQKNDVTYKKSKVLVKHLFSRKNLVEEGLLHSICDIRFIATDPVGAELRAIYPQFGEGRDDQTPYIAFKGSLLSEHDKAAWTTASILPQWANPREYVYLMEFKGWKNEYALCNAVIFHLHILTEPTMNQVVFHCQNVCSRLAKENEVDATYDQRVTRTSVMLRIYSFLQKNSPSSTFAKERLDDTPCILVQEGQRFVFAKQVVIELYESLEIKPFLYRMPNELSRFSKLFEYLGCSPSVTPSNYVMVLDMLHEQCQDESLHVNEVNCALKAVKGLMETMQDSPDAAQVISSLYLPATCSYSACLDDNNGRLKVALMKATELIFENTPLYRDRIKNFNVPFVVDFDSADVSCKNNANYEDLIMLLPSNVRPHLMSCVIEEKFLNSSDNAKGFDIGAASSLRKQLHSEQFYRGIVRLLRHVSRGRSLDQNMLITVKSGLERIEFLGMKRIITHLVHNGVPIIESEREVPYFLEKVLDSGHQFWKVYVNAVDDVDETMSRTSLTLSEVIAEVCNGLLREATMYIPVMLRSPPGKIWSLLDSMGIRQDDSNVKERGDVFPQPGSFIPIAEHNLLNPAFKFFEPGEYVGYELDDPSLHLEEGDAVFIYAVILKDVSGENVSFCEKSYQIDIGHEKEPKVARATKLYKFHRLQEIASSATVLSDQQGSSPFYNQEIFDDISRILEDAWKLSEDIRRQIIKRLILQWHPDKNPGNEVFCTEIFQHIKNEIERLEREQLRRCMETESPHGSYGVYFPFWGARARQYNSQRQEYTENFIRHHGSWSHRSRSWEVPPSFCTTNPQPAQARRWFRQAEADLAAADNDISSAKPSFVWACFKCHQAAEKALKAAQYSLDSNKTTVHNLVQNSLSLDDSQLTTLSGQLESRVGDSTRMRYPDQVNYPEIPSDVYSEEIARDAVDLASRVLENVRRRIR